MKTTEDQFAVLDRMKDEGRISAEEYEDLKAGFLESHDVTALPEAATEIEEIAAATSTTVNWENRLRRLLSGFEPPKLRSDISREYVGAVMITGIVLLIASIGGLMPGWLAFLLLVAFEATLFRHGRIVTVGIALMVGWMLFNTIFGGSEPATNPPPAANAEPDEVQRDPIEGSLGVFVEDLTDAWNTVADPPAITKGLTRYAESGQYDSFLYRFGEWGRLAGAYDPADDAVYALLATAQMNNAGAADMYQHVCFVVHPYSQECIDMYLENGLGGSSLTDFVDTTHNSEWKIDDKTWQLEIASNVLTMRVLSEKAG
ncbi:MAG: hypothetical protein WBM90_09160 [Acidimicrobiia bacterium]